MFGRDHVTFATAAAPSQPLLRHLPPAALRRDQRPLANRVHAVVLHRDFSQPARSATIVGVQDISIVTSRLPTVDRPQGSRSVYLTFEGLRESRTVADKLTRVRIAMPASELPRLLELLSAS